jgi:hypothetical protein
MSSDPRLDLLRREIGLQLETYLRPLLPALGDYRLTFLARIEGEPEADVLVTQDEEAGILEAMARSFQREGGGDNASP